MAQPSNTRSGNTVETFARENRWREAGFAAALLAVVMLLGVSPTSAQCGNDPGNDYLAAATPVPGCTNVPADIDCVGDVDYYSFVAPNSGGFTFQTSSSMDLVMKLYDPNGAVIEENDDGGAYQNPRIDESLVAGATYKVAVNDYGYNDMGPYQLEITGCSSGGDCSSDQNDDDFSTATTIPGCATQTARIDCADDIDFFTFTAQTSGSYSFTVGASNSVFVTLYDSGRNVVQQTNSSVSTSLGAGGMVFVRVAPVNNGEVFQYGLTATGCSSGGCTGDQHGDSIPTALILNDCGVTSASIDCLGDADYFGFTPNVAGAFTFYTTGGTDTFMQLLDDQHNILTENDDGGEGYNSRIEEPLIAGLAYFVRVEEFGGDATGAYDLVLTGCVSVDPCGDDPGNDSIPEATDLPSCGTTPAAIDCAGDVDYYEFTAPSAATYTFETTGSTDTVVQLLDGQHNILDESDDDGEGYNGRIEYALSVGDTVWVRVNEYADNDTGSYSLVVSGCSGGGGQTRYSYIVAAAAKVAGSAGTNWVSDLVVLNQGWDTTTVTVEMWLKDQANPNPTWYSFVLAAGEQRRQEDVLASFFAASGVSAALRVSADQPLVVSTRTFNDVGAGTYGQFIPGVPEGQAFVAGEPAYLAGLVENGGYRSNLGLVNPTASPVQVTAQFYRADGTQLGGQQSYTVPAQGYLQQNRVLSSLGSGSVEAAWVRLQTAQGQFFAFASVVDEVSGDPVYRGALRGPSIAYTCLLPGVAKLAGAAGTNWVTDGVFLNVSDSARSVTARLWMRNEDNAAPEQRSVDIPARSQVSISDLMINLFGSGAGAAALEVAADPWVLVDGRTYNLVSSGTYGQYIPAMLHEQAAFGGIGGYLVMASQGADFRTNLGLINPLQVPVEVEVRLHGLGGALIGSAQTYILPARRVTQIDRVAEEFTSQDVASAYLEVRLTAASQGDGVHAYISVVDQQTGDPIFETMTLEEPPVATPPEY